MSAPDEAGELTVWQLLASLFSEPPRRKKLNNYNTMDDAVNLIQNSKKIIVLTGAGISVSCGIPDFRSKDGIYAKLAVEYPDLSQPQDMFDIGFFSRNPEPFFKFASEVYPGELVPSVSHRFIKHLEDKNKLLRNYTQNIDTLEQCAGIENVIQCHGSFATASCMVCRHKVNSDVIKDEIMKQQIPHCPKCSSEDKQAIMKPDIVFFGEGLPQEYFQHIQPDQDQCDLLIVIGSSLKVRPVSMIPNSLPATTPQILINREPLLDMTFDIELLGNCDVVIETLARRLGWSELFGDVELREVGPEHVVDDVSKSGAAATLDQTQLGEGNQKSADSAKETYHETSVQGASCQPEERVSLAQKLPEGTYAFLPPNKYLFPGGELMNYNPNENGESDDNSSPSANSDDDSPDDQPSTRK